MTREPFDFAIIGAQKCGTTALSRILRKQPGVSMVPGEIDWFERGEAHRDQVSLTSRPGQLVGFKRPNILPSRPARERLTAEMPDIRLIVLLRDPSARAVAATYHYIRDGFLPIRPADELLGELLDTGQIAGHPRASEILTFGRYGEQLEGLLRLVPGEQVLVGHQADLRDDASGFYDKLSDFLGLDIRPVSIRTTMPTTYDAARLKLWRRLNPLMYKYDRSGMALRPRSRRLNGLVNLLDGSIPQRKKHASPQVSSEVVRRLEHYYAADSANLRAVATSTFQGSGYLKGDRDPLPGKSSL